MSHNPHRSRFQMMPSLCHDGPKMVFTAGNAVIWGGSRFELLRAPIRWSLLVCCGGLALAPDNTPVVSSAGVPDLIRGQAPTPWVALDWDDGGVPDSIPIRYWHDLASVLAGGQIDGNVGFYCMGGHGRTGTALSITAALTGAVPEGEDPVEWLRDRYCEEAVETDEQCRYVEQVTGRAVSEGGSFMMAWQRQFAQFDVRRAVANLYKDDRREPITNAAGDIVGYSQE